MNILFLDLEETVIDDWFEGNILHSNLEKIKRLAAEHQCTSLGLFSWATQRKDVPTFNAMFRNEIEKELQLKFNEKHILDTDTVSEIMSKTRKFNKPLEQNSFFDFWGLKTSTFLELCWSHFIKDPNIQNAVLVDDTTHNATFEMNKKKFTLVNVNSL